MIEDGKGVTWGGGRRRVTRRDGAVEGEGGDLKERALWRRSVWHATATQGFFRYFINEMKARAICCHLTRQRAFHASPLMSLMSKPHALLAISRMFCFHLQTYSVVKCFRNTQIIEQTCSFLTHEHDHCTVRVHHQMSVF